MTEREKILRDRFALAALQALIPVLSKIQLGPVVCVEAYRYADWMLTVRRETGGAS